MQDNPNKAETMFRLLTPIIATLIASVVATYATYTYNQRQMQLAHIEALDKYRTYINSNEYATREYGFFVFEELGYSKLVDKLADVRKDPAALKILLSRLEDGKDKGENSKAVQIADDIMREAASAEQQTLPATVSTKKTGATKEGWVYLGHFVSNTNNWKTRYLNFSVNADPSDLIGETFEVRKETGALNVRVGMPTVFGRFREVQDVLEVGSNVKIVEYSEWLSSGYIWAKVRYGT